jgi:glucokinase
MSPKALLLFITLSTIAATKSHEYILGASIGRYDTQLGIFKVTEHKPELVTTLAYKTTTITNFTEFLESTLHDLASQDITITRACFAVPGNTSNRLFIQAPHLSFPVDGQEMMQRGLLKQVFVLNDFEIQGYGIDSIDPKNIIQISKGAPRENAPKALVGAGAGLGSVLMIWDTTQQQYESLPLGACFTDFAPQNNQEMDFAQYIRKNVTHCDNCSWGQVLGSGSGIRGMYNYFSSLQKSPVSIEIPDAETIFAQKDVDPLCKQAVELYMRLYAQLIRTMTYVVLPYGGLYITNSLAINHSDLVTSPEFLSEIFNCRHDWLKNMLCEIPLYVVTDPTVTLYGAAHYLLQHAY